MPICAVRVLEHRHDSHCHLNSTYYVPGTMPSALCEVINPPAAAGARALPSSEFYRWEAASKGGVTRPQSAVDRPRVEPRRCPLLAGAQVSQTPGANVYQAPATSCVWLSACDTRQLAQSWCGPARVGLVPTLQVRALRHVPGWVGRAAGLWRAAASRHG